MQLNKSETLISKTIFNTASRMFSGNNNLADTITISFRIQFVADKKEFVIYISFDYWRKNMTNTCDKFHLKRYTCYAGFRDIN